MLTTRTALLVAALALPNSETPLQCWWRTSTPAVRVAEPFSLLLTCAIEESETVHVVVDQAKLGPDAIAVSPFEVIGGGELTESAAGSRRFFQREYRLRVISDQAFGRDLLVPPVVVSYRLQQSEQAGARTQGIERHHELPALPVRVVSLVSADARDIRDTSAATFAQLDEGAFRASVFVAAGQVLLLVGTLGLGLALARGVRRQQPQGSAIQPLTDRLVLKEVGRELDAIRHAREAASWTPDLIGRALAAVRVGSTYPISRTPAQRPIEDHEQPPEGVLLHHGRRGQRIAISAAVTPQTLETHTSGIACRPYLQVGRDARPFDVAQSRPEPVEGRAKARAYEKRVNEMQTILAEFTRAQYGQQPVAPATLDDALDAAERIVRDLKHEHTWVGRKLAPGSGRFAQVARMLWSR
jgi:hypothetical protein